MLVEISAQVAQATSSSTWVDAPLSRVVPDTDAARFSSLLADPPSLAPAGPAPVAQLQAAAPVGGVERIGDSILQGLRVAGQNYVNGSRQVQAALHADVTQLTSVDIIRMQMDFATVSLHVDVLTKGISKAVQDVDQLTKLQ
ncbi:MAG: EscI/YscI/HrpB family type III secretion system inner rod protein [Pseudomonadota bacterium]